MLYEETTLKTYNYLPSELNEDKSHLIQNHH